MREAKGSANRGGASARKTPASARGSAAGARGSAVGTRSSAAGARGSAATGARGAVPNSAIKKLDILEPYHDLATALFNLKSAEDYEREFVSAARDGDLAKVQLLLQKTNEVVFSIDARDRETGNTAIIWATKRGHNKIVQLLLQHGADITVRNYEGHTAVEVASPQIRKQLLDSNDSGGARRNLLQASWQGNAQLVKKILAETRVDINCRNADNLTPLLLVTRDVQLFEKLGERVTKGSYDPHDVLGDLLSFRADLNAIDEEGRTALHYVSSSKASHSCDLASTLIQEGCDLEVKDRRCFTPIHCASQSGNAEVVVTLLDSGCSPNIRGFAGTTPLHISAINGHDQIATTLLQYGADVTLVDDSGLSPVDVAKTKKVKSTLKQAWTEATKVKEVQKETKEAKTGEVIFDSLPTASATSIDGGSPRKQSASLLHLSNTERARRADIAAEGKYSAAKVRARAASRSPPPGCKLSPLRSPRKNSRKELKFGPGTKLHDGTTSRHFTPLQKCPSDPCRLGSQGSSAQGSFGAPPPSREATQIPVTILGLDLDDNLQPVKLKHITPGPSGQPMPYRKGHARHHSDPFAPSPCPSEAPYGEDFYYKGRSPSKASILSTSEDFEDQPLSSSPPHARLNPLRTPSANERSRYKIPGAIPDRLNHKKGGLDLDRMQLTGQNRSPVLGDHNLYMYPHSRKVLPPTPTFITQDGYHDNLDSSQESSGSSKDSSPRSDVSESEDQGIKFTAHNPQDLLRAKSIIPQGVFNIESTRVARSSNDSGLPDDKSQSGSSNPGSKSSSVSSSVSTFSSNGSPRGLNESQVADGNGHSSDKLSSVKLAADGSNATAAKATVTKAQVAADTSQPKQSSADQTSKLRSAAKDNAARTRAHISGSGAATVVPKDKITVHHSDSTGDAARDTKKTNTAVQKTPQTKPEAAAILKQSDKVPVRSTAVTKPTPGKAPGAQGQGLSNATNKSTSVTTSKATTSQQRPASRQIGTKPDTSAKTPIQRSLSRQDTGIAPKATPRGAAATPRTTAGQKTGVNNKVVGNSTTSAASKPARPPSPLTKVSETGGNKMASSVKRTSPPRPPSPQIGPSGARTVPVNGSNNKVVSGAKKSPPPRPPSPSVAALGASKTAGKTSAVKQTGIKPASTTVVTMTASGNNSNSSLKPANSTTTKTQSGQPGMKPAMSPAVPVRKSSNSELTVTPVTPKTSDNPPQRSQDTKTNPLRRSQDSVTRRSLSRLHGSSSQTADTSGTSAQSDNGPASPTKKAEMTPVTGHNYGDVEKAKPLASSERRSSTRQITVQPAEDTFNFSTREQRPTTVEHTGPIIYDPFESLRKEQERLQSEEERVDAVAKGGRNSKQKVLPASKKAGTKQESRMPSAGKKRSKSKDRKQSASGTPSDPKTGRPKSGKTKTKGKKKKKGAAEKEKTTLSDRADQSNVAFVSGIGWHVETECYDKTDVHAVVIRSDDSDSDLDNHVKVVPNYTTDLIPEEDYIGPVDKLRTSLSNSSLRNSKDYTTPLPGQICRVQSDSEESDSDSFLSDVEVAEDEVIFLEKLPQELEGNTPRVDGEGALGVVAQTTKAIDEFSKTVSKEELDKMLGGNTQTKSGKPSSSSDNGARKETVTTTHVVTMTNPQTVSEEKPPSTVKLTPVEKLRRTGSRDSSPRTDRSRKGSSGSKQETEDKKNNNNSGKLRLSLTETPRDDAEIDSMIDEIIKATPNPSMTESWKSLSKNAQKDKKANQRSMTREDFENELRKSQGEKTFRQLPNKPTPVMASSAGADGGNNSPPSSAANSVTLTDSFWSGPNSPKDEMSVQDLEIEDLDYGNKEMEKLANACRNMELQVKVETPRSVKGKPPPVPRMAISPTEKRSSQPEKSPRFIRKHDSFKEVRDHKDEVTNYGSFCSELDSLNLPSMGENSLLDDRVEVVTSRLGRRSAVGSRMSSAVTNTSSAATDDDIIQWKRGNMLGKGAYGTVWCGLTNSGELIAVKQIVLNTNDMDRAELEYEKIQEEVELLKTLKHKNIVGYLGTSLEESTVSIFMQFVPGGSIANLLARFGALEEETFCHYTKQILEGVEYLHANNVIHRDIKGGNIMLMPNSVIKLIDFGCAKRLCFNMSSRGLNSSQTRLLKSMRGTPYWMAPEVVREEGHGTKSDMWSIGCTVFEMATKTPPWADMQPMSAIFVIGNNSKPVPQLPEKFSQEARDFTSECMTRDPNTRPSATELLNHVFIVKRKKKSGTIVI